MISLSGLIAWRLPGAVPLADVGLGWTLALLNGIAAAWIYKRAFSRTGNAFLFWALGINGVRTLCALTVVVALFALVVTNQAAFIVAVLSGTACYLVSEIRFLHLALAN
ncbi:MAG: hypothetical protein O2923_05805 [Verrucomicrobia bacterium]|nr:hypothetical protein [Verrucomicrobiota bacterium]MDA1085866.1 hypothetical protein [Verrucomicrobiota bacterium]